MWWVADKLVYRGEDDFIRAFWGNDLVWEKYMPDYRIYYTSTDQNIVVPFRDGRGPESQNYAYAFGARVVSNVYNDFGILTFDDTVTKVDYGFANKNTLLTIKLPDSVSYIGLCAFNFATNLVEVNIPEGVQVIYESAFYGCRSLPSITLPSTITNIGWLAFSHCDSLEEVIIMATVPPVLYGDGKSVFENNAPGRLIKVPAGSVEAYKAAAGWSEYADYIVSQ